MAADLTIACVYRRGKGFTDEYVYRLCNQVAEHCKVPYRFVCLTNHQLRGVVTVPFLRDWPGWWSKLELFREGLFSGQVVYFDLDTMICRDFTDIATYPHSFTAATNFGLRKRDEVILQSGFMAWNAGLDLGHLFNNFEMRLRGPYEQDMRRWGDQGWIQDHIGRPFESVETLFPGRVVHYKTHVRPTKESQGKVPQGASIVCFSGRPRPHEIQWSLPLVD